MATQITEHEARKVAEEAREGEWSRPSFGKDLFLGRLRLDLIHPQPQLDASAVERGERFLERLRAFLVESVDPLEIERDARIPEAVIDGLKELGALGMKVPEIRTMRHRWSRLDRNLCPIDRELLSNLDPTLGPKRLSSLESFSGRGDPPAAARPS